MSNDEKKPEPAVRQKLTGTYDKKKTAEGLWELGKHVVEKFSNKDFPGHADDKGHGAKQYRLIAIPSPDTKLLLGQHVTHPEQAGIGAPFGYPGLSFHTDENYFGDVKKNAVFQTTGAATFKTQQKWTQIAKESVAVAAERTTIASGQMFILAAGPGKNSKDMGLTGPELNPPEYDTSPLNKQLVKQYAMFSRYNQKSTVAFSALNVKLGMPKIPLEKLSLLQAAGLWLYAATEYLDKARKKLDEAKKKVEAKKKQVEGAEKTFHKVEAGVHAAQDALGLPREKRVDRAHHEGDPPDAHGLPGHTERGEPKKPKHNKPTELAPSGETSPAAAAPAAGHEGEPEQEVEYDQAQVSRLIDEASKVSDDLETAIHKEFVPALKALEKHSEAVVHKGEEAVDHLKHLEFEQAFEAGFAAVKGAMDVAMEGLTTLDGMIATIQKIMTNAAFRLLYDTSKPRLVLTAAAGVDVQTDGNFHSYVAKGYDFFADGGGFFVHVAKGMTLRAQGSTDIAADASLTLRGHKGAELAALGAVFLTSRDKTAEVLGTGVYLGSYTPAESRRATQSKDALGHDFTAATQKPTHGVRLEAEKKIVSHSKDQQVHVADKTLVLSVGLFKIVVTDKQVLIGHADDPQDVKEADANLAIKPPKDHLVEINARGVLINKKNAFVNVVEDHITLGKERNHNSAIVDVDTAKGNFKVDGTNVNLNTKSNVNVTAKARVNIKGQKVLLG